MKSTFANTDNIKLHLSFESKCFGNDQRMLRTTRDFIVDKDSLHFTMKMATQKTPEFQDHLESYLLKTE